MAYEFSKLSEVESLSEVPETATVLAEVEGEIKRVPSSGLGGGSVVVAVFNIDTEAGTVTCDKTFEECVEANNENCLFAKARFYLSHPSGMNGYMSANLHVWAVENDEGFILSGNVFNIGDIYIEFRADGTLSGGLS